ncbi:MAG: cell wall hydrolase [Novosphingobium sp.]
MASHLDWRHFLGMKQLAATWKGPSDLSAWLSRELALLVWTGSPRKQLMFAAPLIGGSLFGASLLLASVPAQQPNRAEQRIALVREEFTPPMVRLLEEMNRASRGASPGASLQDAKLTGPIAAPFVYGDVGADRDRALTCLATAAWFEAGRDPAGQRAVMQVVLNRVRHPSFPKSVCAVVFQGAERRTGCQFSFTCDGSMSRRIPSPVAWAEVRARATSALDGAVDPDVGQATHFHADYVNPWWAAKLDPIVKIGAHIFYRWSGARGALGSANTTLTKETFPALAIAYNANVAPTGRSGVVLDAVAAAGSLPKVPTLREDAVRMAKLAVETEPMAAAPASQHELVMHVDRNGPNGRWALSAMSLCSGSGACRVIAADDGASSAPREPGQGEAQARPLFLFARDAAGMQVALWDCERAPRPRTDQCLPSGAELKALLD